MAVILDSNQVDTHLTTELAVEAIEQLLKAEDAGTAHSPNRLDVNTGAGFLRMMPGVLHDMMGFKVMTLVEGLGTRYLVMLFDMQTGELLAGFDADELTRTRTAATTAVACRLLTDASPESMALIGSGFEAEGHLRAFVRLFPITEVALFSPTRRNRERFAMRMSDELGLEIETTQTAEDAVAMATTVVLATKAKQPVVNGSAFRPRSVVLSIGSTRLDLRELDRRAFQRASWVVGDSPAELLAGSADVVDAMESGAIDESRLISLASASHRSQHLPIDDDRDLVVFKSMGTSTQDLAVARSLYHHIRDLDGIGIDIGDVPSLKRFSPSS